MTSATLEKILLVDDDEVFTQVMSRALSRKNFDVYTASTVKDATNLASSHAFSRAILDLKLKEESGLTLVNTLQTLQSDIRIVILTGYSSVSTAVEAIKLGAINYLCKPAPIGEVLAAFDKLQGDANASIAETPPSVDRLEWEHIQKVLREQNGNISATARALGMHRRTLQRKLQKRPAKH